MAFRVEWSKNAQKERKFILLFWTLKTGNKKYSKKLNDLFTGNIEIISQFPLIGKKTEINNLRAQIIGDYILFYRVKVNTVYIVSLFGSKQNPDKLKTILK